MTKCKAGECTHTPEVCRNHCYADRGEVLATFNAKSTTLPLKTGNSTQSKPAEQSDFKHFG